MSNLRIGLIGAGGMGSFHARTLAALSGVQVVAVADPFTPNAEALEHDLGAIRFDDGDALITNGALDGLVIASTDETHAHFARAAIDASVPTLCEKPVATTIADALSVAEAESRHGSRLIQLGFMREYDPAHVQLKDTAAGNGRTEAVRALHRNANLERRPLDQIVGQSMVHDIHSVRFLTGSEIVAVHASGSGTDAGPYRHIVATCRLASGAHAVIEFDDSGFAYEVSVELVGEHGDALTGAPVRPVSRRDGAVQVALGTDWFGWFAEAYRMQDQAWVDSIRAGAASGPSVWDGVVAQQVVEAIVASLSTGQSVSIAPLDRPALYDS